MRIFLVLIAVILGSVILPSSAAAQACQPLYGGGETKEQYCPTPTPIGNTQQNRNNQATRNQAATKGGLPVNKPANTTTTPDTGPAALGLLALAPAAVLGVYLRRKA